jgi:hypothetical protein
MQHFRCLFINDPPPSPLSMFSIAVAVVAVAIAAWKLRTCCTQTQEHKHRLYKHTHTRGKRNSGAGSVCARSKLQEGSCHHVGHVRVREGIGHGGGSFVLVVGSQGTSHRTPAASCHGNRGLRSYIVRQH